MKNMKIYVLINNIDLKNLTTSTIKKPKIQETSTLKLIGCLNKNLLCS